MSMVGFPLLLIPLAVYNIVAFLMPGLSLAEPLFKLPLMSGAELPITLSDILLALGVLMLLFEVVKGARPGAKYLTDHLLSLIMFGAAAAEFVLWPKFGTSIFFLLTLLALVDFLSGVSLRRRRYAAAGVTVAPAARKSARQAEPEFAEPAHERAPAPAPAAPAAVPSAAAVAESVLLDHPEPSMAQTAMPSPDIQPGNVAHPPPDAPPR